MRNFNNIDIGVPWKFVILIITISKLRTFAKFRYSYFLIFELSQNFDIVIIEILAFVEFQYRHYRNLEFLRNSDIVIIKILTYHKIIRFWNFLKFRKIKPHFR